MTTLPTESVLNWSSEKPTFEQVKGKRVWVKWGVVGNEHNAHATIDTMTTWKICFQEFFLRYAIIAEPLEAKELWGIAPKISTAGQFSRVEYRKARSDNKYVLTDNFLIIRDTESEAITAWNQLVDKIEEERMMKESIEVQVLQGELDWSIANRSDTRFDDGFIAGIKQAIRLVKLAQEKVAETEEEEQA